MADVILIDDDPEILQFLRKFCERIGHTARAFQSGRDGMNAIRDSPPHVVIVDLRMDDLDGLAIIRQCGEEYPEVSFVMITGYGTVETAVEAMKLGAFDYLTKPIELEDLQRTIDRAMAREENQMAQRLVSGRMEFVGSEADINLEGTTLIGESPRMLGIHGQIEKIANNDQPILLRGEFGTGKQVVARTIHKSSKRRNAPFKVLDCSSLPENLLEAELFGAKDSRGATIFGRAAGGTVLLEEIHVLPWRLQSLLESYLEDVSAKRVSGRLAAAEDVRLITSTNKAISGESPEVPFREDLYYKLSIIQMEVPPLRVRSEDIALLVTHFLKRNAAMNQREPLEIDDYALDLLTHYEWPGNVSELQNTVEGACALAEGNRIRPLDLPAKITNRVEVKDEDQMVQRLPVGDALSEFLKKQERLFIRETLKFNEGSREKTATMLGVSIATLYRKMDLKFERDSKTLSS